MPDVVDNPLNISDLYAAFKAADNIVLKKYISQLSDAPCIELSKDLKSIEIGDNVYLYKISKIVYDKNENTQDKLTTVYSTIFSLSHCGLAMLINGKKDRVELYLGIITRNMNTNRKENGEIEKLVPFEKDLTDYGKVLKNVFIGNFPGTDLEAINKQKTQNFPGINDIINKSFENTKYISAVSSIPAIRNSNEIKNQEFVQGLEKFIESLKRKEYVALIIADGMSNDKIETMCAEYEDIYSQLAPFKSSTQTVNAQNSVTDTESIIKGVTKTTNKILSKSTTHGTAISKTHSDSFGGSINTSLKPLGIGADVTANYNHAYSRAKTKTDSKTDTESNGTAESIAEQNSVAKALSSTTGESIQISYENRAVKTLLDSIDEQIKRMRSCEDFGMFDTCAYFAAQDYDVAVAAASSFKSLTRGQNSSVESSAVNVWKDETDVKYIKEYLTRFYHPEFLTIIDENHNYPTTATMLVSGKEMAFQMPLPKKSVAGISVVECAEFGRETISLVGNKGNIPLGKIYHMHQKENLNVALDADRLSAHTFITGSTGSGKSTTIYKLLDEIANMNVNGTDDTIKFLVIEPAKGEYKYALSDLDVKVYGTNPKLTNLLRINPFRFPTGKIHIYEHLDRLTELFNVCWPMYAAMPAVLKAAMENAYRSAGWNLIESTNKYGEDIFPSFVDVAIEVEKYINNSEYSEENKSNYKGALLTRLESLTTGINSLIFSANDIEDKDLFDENVIIDLSRVGASDTKALIMGVLVLKLQEYRTSTVGTGNSSLRHITVLEEAHNLLKRTSTEQTDESSNLLGKSVEMLANSIAEMRTYGEGFIIADQSPGLLDMSVIRNTNTKIIMRLPDFSDRELVGKAAGLNDDQIIELAKLPRGVAAVYQNDWIAPVLCSVDKPNFETSNYKEEPYHADIRDESLLFDLLDSKFVKKLDETDELDKFKKSILKSTAPTQIKIKLISYLKEKNKADGTRILASTIFDYFKNTKEVVEKTANEVSAEDLRTIIMAELDPSINEFDDEQIDILITLILKEYNERYLVDCPVWHEFADYIRKGGII